MIWDEDYITPKEKHSVGRPLESPFNSAEMEEDFIRRGKAMMERYYKPQGPNTRKSFVFGPGMSMSKTQFWAIIFIYLVESKHLRHNLQGFLTIVQTHFGTEAVSDRAAIHKNVGMQEGFHVTCNHLHELSGAEGRAQKGYRSQYRYVVKTWEEAGEASVCY